MSRGIRIFSVIVLNILVLIFIVTIAVLSHQYLLIRIILHLASLVFIISILFSENEYYSKIIWISLLIVAPLLGIIIYFSFGQTYNHKNIYAKKVGKDKDITATVNTYFTPTTTSSEKPESKTLNILQNMNDNNIYSLEHYDLLINGRMKFSKLIEEIENAQNFIHLQYYIISDSNILDYITQLLIKKSQEGVEVRILYDVIGSKSLSKKNYQLMEKNGIKVESFGNFFVPFLNNTLNFRNHRKIAIIDGRIGFTGGINIGDEYIGYSKKYGYWQDSHIAFEGEVVQELHSSFAKDWYYCTGENFFEDNPEKYISDIQCDLANDSLNDEASYVQIINNGPDNKDTSVRELYFKLITSAEDEITIYTPYLVPGSDMITALVTAAKNGVKIKIFMPGKPDKISAYSVSRSYYGKLLIAGIEIFEVNNSFLHTKLLIIDDSLAAVGTTNFDYRSFNLNFETTAFIESLEFVKKLKVLNDIYVSQSKKMTLKEWEQRHFLQVLYGKILQLFTPLF